MIVQGIDNKYMLVLEERLYYLGLAGNKMKARRFGAAAIYAAPEGGLAVKLGDGEWRSTPLAILPPYAAHEVASDCGAIVNVLIEPERLRQGELQGLLHLGRDPSRAVALAQRLRAAAPLLEAEAPDDPEDTMSAATFDRIVLGRPLADRRIDRRIAGVLDDLAEEGLETPVLAADLAAGIGLSSSRFLHLFKEETGVSFRNYRTWRRARGFLPHANRTGSLTDVALSLGYPDSSHFSHSIRKTFGLKPRSIRVGSRNLRVDCCARLAQSLYEGAPLSS